jgi:hypothetical protein
MNWTAGIAIGATFVGIALSLRWARWRIQVQRMRQAKIDAVTRGARRPERIESDRMLHAPDLQRNRDR